MIHYLFDTDACVYLIRGKTAVVAGHMSQHPHGSLAISTITLSELRLGVAKSSDPTREVAVLARFLTPFIILPYDNRAAVSYGPLRAHLESAGTSIGPLDTLIAAHALSLNLTLITNNQREFRRVPGLKVENWTRP